MNQLAIIPKVAITIRPATMDDLAFLDALQKKYNKALGFFPRAQMEGYIAAGNVLVAEGIEPRRRGGTEANLIAPDALTKQPSQQGVDSQEQSQQCLSASVSRCLRGYIISKDRYLKRDELGVIFQLCVEPGTQRKLVGAALVQAAFDRSAYGCRLYCCWCAKDLEANYFWESMGFVPVAFRAGSTGKRRVHIFWQKKIVDGDSETKWWYPSQTSSGAIRADRLVFPIPPGVHWKDVEAAALPIANRQLPIEGMKEPAVGNRKAAIRDRRSATGPQTKLVPMGGFQFASEAPAKPRKKPRANAAPAAKINGKLLSAARELRDRYLERMNAAENEHGRFGKYTLTRRIAAHPADAPTPPRRLLPQAA